MSRIIKIFLIIILLAAVGAAGWFWFINKDSQTINNEPIDNTPIANTPLDITPPADTNPAVTSEEQQLKSLARLFATAYGSYSTDAPWQNLKELSYLYTPSFEVYINQYINQTSPPAGYYSVNTRALAAQVVSASGDLAVVTVDTQRDEVFSLGGVSQLSYEILTLQFNKVNGQWKVNSAVWE